VLKADNLTTTSGDDCLEIWEPPFPRNLRACAGVVLPLLLIGICSILVVICPDLMGSDVSEESAVTIFRLLSTRQYVSSKCWFPAARRHGFVTPT